MTTETASSKLYLFFTATSASTCDPLFFFLSFFFYFPRKTAVKTQYGYI